MNNNNLFYGNINKLYLSLTHNNIGYRPNNAQNDHIIRTRCV